MQWLEVSLSVNGETAEAVADVLARFAPEGVALEATRLETSPETDETRPEAAGREMGREEALYHEISFAGPCGRPAAVTPSCGRVMARGVGNLTKTRLADSPLAEV